MPDYDAIIIGAGNGGLTAAVTLAQRNKKVLLLERHNVPGGCATSFIRGRFEFEASLHQLSGIGTKENPGPLRVLLENLGVMDKVEFVHDDYLYSAFIPGEYNIKLKADRAEIVETLKSNFPKESAGIEKFFDLVVELTMQYLGAAVMRDPEFSKSKYPLYSKYAFVNTDDVLDAFFKDPNLKAIIASFWVYLGLPPSKCPFTQMAIVLWAYSEYKPSHIKGGSQALSNALLDSFLEAGGDVRFSCGAKKIVVSNGKVKSVITEEGDEISTNHVISNAGNLKTYMELIDREHVPLEELKLLQQRKIGHSIFCVYMGLDCEPQDIGIETSANFVNHNVGFKGQLASLRTFENPHEFGITCYDIENPEFSPKGACMVSVINNHYIDPWLAVPPGRYAEAKYQYAQKYIEAADQIFPGMSSYIEEMEIASPLTCMRFLGHPGGAICGFSSFAKDLDTFVRTDSPIAGLHFTGAWINTGGFMPCYESGVQEAEVILNSLEKK